MTKRVVMLVLFIVFVASAIGLLSERHFFKNEVKVSSSVIKNLQEQEIQKQKLASMTKEEKAKIAAEQRQKLIAQKLELGKEVYTKKGNCLQCHGANGEGLEAELAPKIAGQHDWYIKDQIQRMMEGTRVNEKMMEYISGLSKDDVDAVVVYITQELSK